MAIPYRLRQHILEAFKKLAHGLEGLPEETICEFVQSNFSVPDEFKEDLPGYLTQLTNDGVLVLYSHGLEEGPRYSLTTENPEDKEQIIGGPQDRDEAVNDDDVRQLILQAFTSISHGQQGLPAETIFKELTSKYTEVPQDFEKDLPGYLTRLTKDGLLALCSHGLGEELRYSLTNTSVKTPGVKRKTDICKQPDRQTETNKPYEAVGDKEQVVGGPQARDEAVNDGEKDQKASDGKQDHALSVLEKNRGGRGKFTEMIICAIRSSRHSQYGLSENKISSSIISKHPEEAGSEDFPRLLRDVLEWLVQNETLTMNVVGVDQEPLYKLYERERPTTGDIRPKGMPKTRSVNEVQERLDLEKELGS